MNRLVPLAVFGFALFSTAAVVQAAEEGFLPLFDGKTLNGRTIKAQPVALLLSASWRHIICSFPKKQERNVDHGAKRQLRVNCSSVGPVVTVLFLAIASWSGIIDADTVVLDSHSSETISGGRPGSVRAASALAPRDRTATTKKGRKWQDPTAAAEERPRIWSHA